MDFDWKATLGKIAPLAATFIGGPWAGLAADAIGAVFGEETTPDEARMEELISKATPAQLMELKQIDAQLKIKMRELDIKEDQLVYDDKDSARDMQKSTHSKMPAVLAIFLTVGFFGAFVMLMRMEVIEANAAMVYSMLGSLGTAWIGSMQFWHGTTKSSQNKTDLLKGK